ncbi:NIPSNAP family protein [Acerihabitans sp. KWT182]|uniref:NIPSNAP family protein n=1 Tax=Acerihabitans sp. KWT182 TaxID=3157919 RepID=A0AAU7Q6R3_9GAMM
MIYELCRISATALNLNQTADRCVQSARENSGEIQLLGAWRTEIGELFQIILLRAYPDLKRHAAARERALTGPCEFAADEEDITVSRESFRKFPFLPDAAPVKNGKFFELRTYFLKPGGIRPTIAAWEKALKPAHEYTSHLIINMYALDGLPRIVHLWSFESLEERTRLREKYYSLKLWPPRGGPEQIAHAANCILLPLAPG